MLRKDSDVVPLLVAGTWGKCKENSFLQSFQSTHSAFGFYPNELADVISDSLWTLCLFVKGAMHPSLVLINPYLYYF